MMNAKEYIQFLETLSSESDNEIRQRIKGTLDYGRLRSRQTGDNAIFDTYNDIFEKKSFGNYQLPDDIRDYESFYIRQFLYNPVLQFAPEPVKSRIQNIPISVLPIRSFNAHIIKSPNGEPIIVIDRGLLTVSHFYFETQAVATSIYDHDGLKAASRCLMDGYSFIVKYFAQHGEGAFPVYEQKISEDALVFSILAAAAIEVFALCHELGHFYLEHLENTSTKGINLTIGKQLKSTNAEFCQLSQVQEFQADIFGWLLYTEVRKKIELFKGSDDDQTLCLYLFILLTIVEKNLDIIDEYSTHPPAMYRLANIIKFMSESNYDEKIVASATNLLKMAQSVPNSKVLKEFYEGIEN